MASLASLRFARGHHTEVVMTDRHSSELDPAAPTQPLPRVEVGEWWRCALCAAVGSGGSQGLHQHLADHHRSGA